MQSVCQPRQLGSPRSAQAGLPPKEGTWGRTKFEKSEIIRLAQTTKRNNNHLGRATSTSRHRFPRLLLSFSPSLAPYPLVAIISPDTQLLLTLSAQRRHYCVHLPYLVPAAQGLIIPGCCRFFFRFASFGFLRPPVVAPKSTRAQARLPSQHLVSYVLILSQPILFSKRHPHLSRRLASSASWLLRGQKLATFSSSYVSSIALATEPHLPPPESTCRSRPAR